MSNLIRAFICALIFLPLTPCKSFAQESAESPRNVVFMVGDGMGFAHVKAYRMYADDPSTDIIEPLPFDALQVGSVSTDSIIMKCDALKLNCKRDPHGFTDSASSATTYATGRDTIRGRISVDPSGKPMRTILEGARMDGKSTGLVSTSQITHATPAAFASHVISRRLQNDIADQFFDSQWQGKPMVNVMLGGGLNYLRRDDRDLVSEFQNAGYKLALNRAELLDMEGDRLLGLFAPSGMPRAWDRDAEAPSLAEMTGVALKSLEQNQKGFFLLVEGSQVDWAGHGNSIAGVISEMEDFVAAVRVVLDFARQHPDTLVIITADHETGGMAVGRDGISRWDVKPLRGMKATPSAMTARYLAGEESLSRVVADNIAFKLNSTEVAELDATERVEDAAFTAIADLFNQRTNTGWSSSGHTGVDVPLYVLGPGKERFHGVMQNENLGRVMREVFLPEK